MSYATLEALRAAVPSSGSTDHEDHTRGIVDALIAGVRPATVTLSSADILALHTTPITLVAAPGAGKVLHVHRAVVFWTYATTLYTFADNVIARYDGPNSTVLDASLDAQMANAGDLTGFYGGLSAGGVFDPATITNAAVQLYAIDGNPADGDGTLTVTCWYSVEDVP